MKPCDMTTCNFYDESWRLNCKDTALAGELEKCPGYHPDKCFNRVCNFYDESGQVNCGNDLVMRWVKGCPGFKAEEDEVAEGICKYDKKSTYYGKGGIETLDIIKKKLTDTEYKGFMKGNIFKYVCRMPYKGDEARDAEKTMNYAKLLWEAVDEKLD